MKNLPTEIFSGQKNLRDTPSEIFDSEIFSLDDRKFLRRCVDAHPGRLTEWLAVVAMQPGVWQWPHARNLADVLETLWLATIIEQVTNDAPSAELARFGRWLLVMASLSTTATMSPIIKAVASNHERERPTSSVGGKR